MGVLSDNRAQIVNGGLISASFVSDVYDVLTGNSLENVSISGSLTITGSLIADLTGTASYAETASYSIVTLIDSASLADSASYAIIAGQLSDVQTTVVNISSAQILNSQATPIDLLPVPGAGKYYDIERIILEYTHGTTGYTLSGGFLIKDDGGYFNKELYNFTGEGANTVVLLTNWQDAWATGASATAWQYGYQLLNSGYQFTTTGGTPTLGDGTLRVIITYTTRTFGA